MTKYKGTLFFLRNQHKIKAALGEEKLKRIKDSMKAVMNTDKEIEREKIAGSKYDVIMIDDVSKIDTMIAFYVINSEFHIYTIAFKEFI